MKLFELCGLIALLGLLLSSPAMGQNEFTAVAVLYSESSCSSTPIAVGFEMSASCATTDTMECAVLGEHSTSFGRMDCTEDHSKYASATFGETPHLLVEFYDGGTACSEAFSSSIAFLADGKCHITESSFAFMASVSTDGSATLKMYEDMYCEDNIFLDINAESDRVGSGACFDNFARLYAGGNPTSTGSWTGGALYAVALYDNDICSGPPMQLKLSQEDNCTDPSSVPSSSCQNTVDEWGSSHGSYACVDDYFGYANTLFGDTPYLVVQNHDEGGCQTFREFAAFRTDGVCSYAPGMDVSVELNMHTNGSVLVGLYEAGGCNGTRWGTMELRGEFITTGACDGESRYYLFGNSDMASGGGTTLSLDTMLPAWLWEPMQPRIFSSY